MLPGYVVCEPGGMKKRKSKLLDSVCPKATWHKVSRAMTSVVALALGNIVWLLLIAGVKNHDRGAGRGRVTLCKNGNKSSMPGRRRQKISLVPGRELNATTFGMERPVRAADRLACDRRPQHGGQSFDTASGL